MKKMFSPAYVFLGTFFSSPLTAIYMLCQNNKAMDVPERNKTIIIIGILLSIFLTTAFNIIIPTTQEINSLKDINLFQFLYVVATLFIPAFAYERYVAKKQLTKKKVRASETYNFRPLWQIILVTVCGFIIYSILSIIVVLILDALNIVDADL